MSHDYQKQAEAFLSKHNIEFRAVLIGDDCPTFCADAEKGIDMDKVNVYPRRTHIHGKHYRCTFSSKGRGHFAIDFWNSYADEEFNALGTKDYQLGKTVIRKWGIEGRRVVEAYDVLACLTKYDPGTFENFCSDFGYDTDSRKAEDVYRAVVKEFHSVQKFFAAEEIPELQEIA